MKAIYTLLVLLAVGYLLLGPGPRERSPGVLVAEAPLQEELDPNERGQIDFQGFTLIYRARFSVKARVLSKERYRFWGYSKLAPWDLALGWGRMSDSDVLKHLKISQSQRFYMWRYSGEAPIPTNEIVQSSANMHMIPRFPISMNILNDLRVGDIVEIKGFLVDIQKNKETLLKTSLTRSDSGAGACEIIFIEEAKVID